jgi:hypothetical protein
MKKKKTSEFNFWRRVNYQDTIIKTFESHLYNTNILVIFINVKHKTDILLYL